MSKKVRSNINKDTLRNLTPFFKTTRDLPLENVNTIVLHWTGGQSLDGAIITLRGNGNGYHFMIEQDGTITQTIPMGRRANHAGYSFGPKGSYVGNYSYGISMVGVASDFKIVKEELMNSLVSLINDMKKINPNLKFITGHHEIAPGRKTDPYNFDFTTLLKKLDSNFTYWKAGDAPYKSPITFNTDKGEYILNASNVTRRESEVKKIDNESTFTSDEHTDETPNG